MTTDTMSAPTASEAAAHESLVASLRNAHALEKQQITVLEAQLDLVGEYPDLHARLTDHIVETREQVRRLEAGLEACGSSSSMVRDAFLSAMGFGQSSVQGIGDEAVLKAVTADIMEEHLEIATYRTLITLADLAGKPDLRPRLEESLHEEEAMADWFDQNLDAITRRFVELKASERQDVASERKSDAGPRDDAETTEGEAPQTLYQTLENAKEQRAHPENASDVSTGSTTEKPAAMPASETRRPTDANAPAAGATRSGE